MTPTRCPLLATTLLALVAGTDRALAQQGLTPGSFVATTMGYSHPNVIAAGNAVVTANLLAGTSTPLVIAGFPSGPAEIPWTVEVESRLSFLLGSQFINSAGIITAGHVYRVAWGTGGWGASRLEANALGEGVCSMAIVGNDVWFTTTAYFSLGSVPSCKLWRMPRNGGVATLAVDLTARGAPGIFGAIGALGTTLHVFTFVSDVAAAWAPGEHWAVDTAANPPAATRIGVLPTAAATRVVGRQYGAAAARWDPRTGTFVIPGVYGEILWRDPVGNNVARRALPGAVAASTDYLATAAAIDTDTGSFVWGDKDCNLEELRTRNADFRLNALRLLPRSTTYEQFVIGLSYVPGAARYLPDGPEGCPRANGQWPVNYVGGRPSQGNPAFAFTLDATAAGAWLLLGSDNAAWNGSLLPYDLGRHGAPGCWLGTNADLGVLFTAAPLRIQVPLPAIVGTFYTQWALLDPAANALGVVLSDCRRMEIR